MGYFQSKLQFERWNLEEVKLLQNRWRRAFHMSPQITATALLSLLSGTGYPPPPKPVDELTVAEIFAAFRVVREPTTIVEKKMQQQQQPHDAANNDPTGEENVEAKNADHAAAAASAAEEEEGKANDEPRQQQEVAVFETTMNTLAFFAALQFGCAASLRDKLCSLYDFFDFNLSGMMDRDELLLLVISTLGGVLQVFGMLPDAAEQQQQQPQQARQQEPSKADTAIAIDRLSAVCGRITDALMADALQYAEQQQATDGDGLSLIHI